jgi:SAM-dependent methyltransferase
VAAEYERRRFSGLVSSGSTERKWRAIVRSLGADFGQCARFLDVPCGTGRFASRLSGAGNGRSAPTSRRRCCACAARARRPARALRRAAAALRDQSFDVVMSIRSSSTCRASCAWACWASCGAWRGAGVVVDLRHRYCWTTWGRKLRALASGGRQVHRYGLREIGRRVRRRRPGGVRKVWLAPGFSEKMVVAARRIG